MNQPSIALFSIVLGSIFLLVDAYVLWRFQRFTRTHSYSPWWSRIAWVLGGIAIALYVFVAWRRHVFRITGFDLNIFMAVCFWYLPKLPIALVMSLSQLIRSTVTFVKPLITKPTTVTSPPPMMASRRLLIQRAAWSSAIIPYAMVGNGMVNTLYDFQVANEEIVLPGLPRAMDGYRLVQISDVHAGSFPDYKPFQEAVRMVRDSHPDAVVITGDFVNAQPDEMPVISRELARLAAEVPVYATLGNHDHYNSDADHRKLLSGIRELGVDLMVNEHRRIGQGAEGFVLAGIDNVGFRQNYGDLTKALAGVHADESTILLAHDPTFWDKSIVGQVPIDLMLSGHTHGGQVSIGMLGVSLSPASFVYNQVAGLYRKGDQMLYVNRGLGTVGPPLRIGVPPEITVFTLRAPRRTDNLA